MESVLVVGLGEVGRPIYELLEESGGYQVYGYDIDPSKTVHGLEEIPGRVEVLHVCYPYMERFVEVTIGYVTRFGPDLVIIHSTVSPGTTRRIHRETGKPVAYSPVRGKHPYIKQHLRFWTKWVAGIPSEAAEKARQHLESIGLKVRIASDPETLELAKLFETVYRAAMIAFWQEAHRVARKYNADIAGIAEFIAEVHQVLRDRPVYYPAYIGGHCLIPNTEIINRAYPSKLWQFILESNQKRWEEQGNPEIQQEIEKVKRIWEKQVPRWYYSGK